MWAAAPYKKKIGYQHIAIGRKISEYWIGKDVERSGPAPVWGIIPAFPLMV
jgi:hypothetical protein